MTIIRCPAGLDSLLSCCPAVLLSRYRCRCRCRRLAVTWNGRQGIMQHAASCEMTAENPPHRYVLRYLKAVKEMKRIINENQLTV
jgi:hypothetical protein